MKAERKRNRNRWTAVIAAALAAALLSGCETIAYYGQAVHGQLELVALARPLEEVRADPATPPALREQLALAARMRTFASSALGLPDNGSYTRYVALDRPFVVWNVVAAREFSVRAERACFPVAGCVSYRGFFSEAAAVRHAAVLRGEGLEVRVGGVPAYSTLGWFDDPLLSTFIGYPEAELARLVFHELAHQQVYLKGDTGFNESYAVAVEREGVRRWLTQAGRTQLLPAFTASRTRQAEFEAVMEAGKRRLAKLYASDMPVEQKRAAKRDAYNALRADYVALKARWGAGVNAAGYDRLLDAGDGLNNALLASISDYARHVPAFERLLASLGGDLPKFHAEVARLAKLPTAERCAALGAPLGAPLSTPVSSAAC